jgi:large subunit ribosomal protein L6
MSRIGRLPIQIPAGVNITVGAHNVVSVKGPKGELQGKFSEDITIKIENGAVILTRPSDKKEYRELHGLTRSLLQNMVKGVHEEFKKELEIVGVGYRAQLQGSKLVLNVGYSHPIEFQQPEGIKFEVSGTNAINIIGIDKQAVGQIAADIRAVRPPEPYKGKGIKYKNEHIRRKEGKTGM